MKQEPYVGIKASCWSRPLCLKLRLLGHSGSLRRASNSTAVLRGLQDALGLRAALDIFPLNAIPLYSEDDDAEHAPEAVRSLRSAIDASDGVMMIWPEYNHGMSGVLKNALDWAPRPYGLSVLKGKPVLTMTASAAFTGGVRAQQRERDARIDTGTPCSPAPDRDRRRAREGARRAPDRRGCYQLRTRRCS
jgi:hypothetical protein